MMDALDLLTLHSTFIYVNFFQLKKWYKTAFRKTSKHNEDLFFPPKHKENNLRMKKKNR